MKPTITYHERSLPWPPGASWKQFCDQTPLALLELQGPWQVLVID